MAEIEIDSNRSAIVATTHLQAPTGGNRVKASDARCAQWDMIQVFQSVLELYHLLNSIRNIILVLAR